jgi:hypothetical protein
MTEIIKKGHYKKPILYFKCDRCHTEFKTDEWLRLHPPRIEGQESFSGPPSYYATCPICNYFVEIQYGS